MKLRNLALSLGAMALLVPATLLAGQINYRITDKSGNVSHCKVLTGTYIRPTAKESCSMGGRRNRTFSGQNLQLTGASPMEALSKLDANFGPNTPSYVSSNVIGTSEGMAVAR